MQGAADCNVVTVARALKFNSSPSWEGALVELQRSAPRKSPGVIENVYQPLKVCYNHLESDEAKNKKLVMAMKPNLVSAEANVCDSEARKAEADL
ncbi:hypothetical protein MTR67_046212 [Solanum verrucosum]|uniref:Uncharacterized protein n=1 Tax=Solanum verrucosum TaxID=315347 RepID=A0AAF0UUU0_SOLVR|nr:hypothetical protein MTR67_046212 [Solanum verrucosum]